MAKPISYNSYNPSYAWRSIYDTENQRRLTNSTSWSALDQIASMRYYMNRAEMQDVRDARDAAIRNEQFDTSMAETRRQHDSNVALKREEIDANKTAATYSGVIQTGLLAYQLADKTGTLEKARKALSTSKDVADNASKNQPAVSPVNSQAAVSGAGVGAGGNAAVGGATNTISTNVVPTGIEQGGLVSEYSAPAIDTSAYAADIVGGTGGNTTSSQGSIFGAGAGAVIGGAMAGYAAGPIASNQQPIREYGRWARFGIGKGRKADEQAAGFHGGTWMGALAGYVAGGPWGALAGGIVGGITGAMSCFVAGTKVTMADLTEKNVEDIEIGDLLLEGGKVYGGGKVLEEGLFAYRGQVVAGSHAVLENGEWKRIKDSDYATPLKGKTLVYPIVNEKHIMIVDGIVFADMQETDHGTNVNDEYRIWYLNLEKERTNDLNERYPNSSIHGSVLRGACKNVEVLRMAVLSEGTSA